MFRVFQVEPPRNMDTSQNMRLESTKFSTSKMITSMPKGDRNFLIIFESSVGGGSVFFLFWDPPFETWIFLYGWGVVQPPSQLVRMSLKAKGEAPEKRPSYPTGKAVPSRVQLPP